MYACIAHWTSGTRSCKWEQLVAFRGQMLAFCPPTLSSIFVDGRGHCPLPRIVPRLHPLQCDCWCWEHHPVSCHRCIPSQQPWCRCCGPIPACKAMRRTITKARMNRQYIVLDSIIHQLPEGSSTHPDTLSFLNVRENVRQKRRCDRCKQWANVENSRSGSRLHNTSSFGLHSENSGCGWLWAFHISTNKPCNEGWLSCTELNLWSIIWLLFSGRESS